MNEPTNDLRVEVTVGKPTTATISAADLARYLLAHGWAEVHEGTPYWQNFAKGEAYVAVPKARNPSGWASDLAHAIHEVARHEERPAHEVLRDVAGTTEPTLESAHAWGTMWRDAAARWHRRAVRAERALKERDEEAAALVLLRWGSAAAFSALEALNGVGQVLDRLERLALRVKGRR